MQQQVFIYKNSRIGYYCFGSGPRLVLCFHGYGETGAGFRFLEKYLGEAYTFIAVDLPFHGETDWKEGLTMTTGDIQAIAGGIAANHPKGETTQQWTLLGFSLGGRVELSLYQAQPGTIDKLVLLAPDGLKVNFWYWLASRTWVGNQFFAFTMRYPGWFFFLLKLFNRFGWVNGSIFKFVNYYIGDEMARRLLYQRWTCLRKLKPGIPKIKSLVQQQHTPVRLLYGRHDRIILPVRGEKFRKDIEAYCTVTVIESGHQVLHEKHAAAIVSALLH